MLSEREKRGGGGRGRGEREFVCGTFVVDVTHVDTSALAIDFNIGFIPGNKCRTFVSKFQWKGVEQSRQRIFSWKCFMFCKVVCVCAHISVLL